MGSHKPAALHGVWAAGAEQSVQITVACGDTGAGTYAIGRTLVAALREIDPTLAVHQKPLKTSLRRIRGLGGVDEVSEHVTVTLNLGGVHVTCGDLPVVDGLSGIIVDNLVHGAMCANYSYLPYTDEAGRRMDGTLTLRRPDGTQLSEAIPFTTRQGIGEESLFVGAVEGAQRTEGSELKEMATRHKEARARFAHAVPALYNSDKVELPAARGGLLRLKAPALCPPGTRLIVSPLEDDRIAPLPVIVDVGVAEVDSSGCVTIPYQHRRDKREYLKARTAVARFEIVTESVIRKFNAENLIDAFAAHASVCSETLPSDKEAEVAIASVPGAKQDERTAVDELCDSIGGDETEVAKTVLPAAIASEPVQIQPFQFGCIKCIVPKAVAHQAKVTVVPRTDGRAELGGCVLVPYHDGVSEGCVLVRVFNPTMRPVSISHLAYVGQFVLDERDPGAAAEFTVEEILDRVHMPPDVTPEDIVHIREMVQVRRRVFATKLGWAHGYRHRISLPKIESGEARPPALPSRRLSPDEYAALKVVVDKQLKEGLIEPARSPFCAQPVLIRKPDGSHRCCLDFRALNSLTVKDNYPLPNIQANLDALGYANLFTTLDLLQGFFQVEIEIASRPATAFATPWGQMQYTRMPMGLTSSPGTFMRLVDATFRGLPPGKAFAFVDDVICPTDGDMQLHMKDVGLVFDRLLEAGFTVRCDKVYFGQKEVAYLGYLSSARGTRPDPRKLQPLLDFTYDLVSASAGSAGRFAGMIGFYHRFIPNLHLGLRVFHMLKAKGAPHEQLAQSLSFRAAFAWLRQQLIDITCLARPDFSKRFHVLVDAAALCGIGSVLQQREEEFDAMTARPVAFWSRVFTVSERNYGARDLECLAFVETLLIWRPYLEHAGADIVVWTDHASLRWLMVTRHQDGSRVYGWVTKIQHYLPSLRIEYVPGKLHSIPDWLSRAFGDAVVLALFRSVAALASLTDADGAGGGKEAGEEDEKKESKVRAVPYAVIRRAASRVAVLMVRWRRADSKFEFFVEQQASSLALPSISPDTTTSTSYKKQLASALTQGLRPQAADKLTSIVLGASSHKRVVVAHSGRGPQIRPTRTHFLVAICPEDELDFVSPHMDSAGFVELNGEMPFALTDDEDFTFVLSFLHELRGRPRLANRWEDRQFKHALHRLRLQPRTSELAKVEAAQADCFEQVSSGQPTTIQEAPFGPAWCTTLPDGQKAALVLEECLRHEPCMVIDLEGLLGGLHGRVSTLQAAVGRPPLHDPACFVFDTHRRELLRVGSVLRRILEGPKLKVAHCCHGDLSALYRDYGIDTDNVFDTAIADAVLCGRHPRQSRGYGTVLTRWLRIVLSHKGTLEHIPGMWDERPLPLRYFVYAFEDVIHGPKLYAVLQQQLKERGLYELVAELSQMLRVRVTLASEHLRPLLPTRIVVALVDNDHVVTIKQGALDFLPHGVVAAGLEPKERKAAAQKVWSHWMGEPPRGVAVAVRAHLKKPILIGNTFLYIGKVADCWQHKAKLLSVAGGDVKLRIRSRVDYSQPAAGCVQDQMALFQYLHLEAERASVAPPCHEKSDTGEADLGVITGPTVSSENVSILLYGASHEVMDRGFGVCIDKTHCRDHGGLFDKRGAFEVSKHAPTVATRVRVLVLTGKSAGDAWRLPSQAVKIGQPAEEAAASTLDLFLGPSVRKGSGAKSEFSIMPNFSGRLAAACGKIESLGRHGNTHYFACDLNRLWEDRSALCASRREFNGFRLIDKYAKQHRGIELAELSTVRAKLGKVDGAVVAEHAERLEAQAIQSLSAAQIGAVCTANGDVLHHSEGNVAALAGTTESESDDGDQLHHSEVGSQLPVLGVNPEFDARFQEKVIAAMGGVIRKGAEGVTLASSGEPGSGAAGVPSRKPMPSRTELMAAQLEHPTLGAIMSRLRDASLCETGDEQRDNELAEMAANYRLAHDGLLLRRGAGEPAAEAKAGVTRKGPYSARIVVPPQHLRRVLLAYHDQMGHAGANRCGPLILQRYYWGSVEEMRETIREYTRKCRTCLLAKVPPHKSGQQHIPAVGVHPYENVGVDNYEMGVLSGVAGYDGTCTFFDFHSRGVRVPAVAAIKSMTAESYVRLLIEYIIRVFGVPRKLRSDNASIFVAAMVRILWKIFQVLVMEGASYHHQAVGAVERFHAILKSLVMTHRVASGQQDNWHEFIPWLELAFNATVNTITGYSPFYVQQVRQPVLPADGAHLETPAEGTVDDWVRDVCEEANAVRDAVARKLRKSGLHAKQKYDLKHDVNQSFKVGHQVLVIKGRWMDGNLPKAEVPVSGPFTVVAVLPKNDYRLVDERQRRLTHPVNVKRLIAYPDVWKGDESKWMMATAEGNGVWPVDKIVGHRVVQRQSEKILQFKIKWTGLGKGFAEWTDCTWRDVDTLVPIAPLLRSYCRDQTDRIPSDLLPEPLELEVHADDEGTPSPSAAARRRSHFRSSAQDASQLPPTREEETDPGVDRTEPATSVTQPANNLEDTFPVGSRVEVLFTSGYGGVRAWAGKVLKSYITRPSNGRAPDRAIVVKWDDERWPQPSAPLALSDYTIRAATQRSPRLDK